MRSPEEVIAAELADWEVPFVHLDVFGTADPAAIARAIADFVRDHLGCEVRQHLFCRASVGSTHGLELADGRRVVLKARPPQETNHDLPLDAPSIASVLRVQSFLSARGYPAPAPLSGPAQLARGLATIEVFMDQGAPPEAHHPSTRAIIARDLHRQIALLRELPDVASLRYFHPPPNRVFPHPHSKLFDIGATADEAGWIEEIARRARTTAEATASTPLLAHLDFRVEHLRVDGDRVVATYDWDSMGVRSETGVLGITAHAFTADWSQDTIRRTPTTDEMLAFIEDYDEQRAKPLSVDERRAARAWAAYWIAYGARISIRPGETEWPEDSWPALLRTSAAALLGA